MGGVELDSFPQMAHNRSKKGGAALAGDEWEKDPGVLFMRRVFSTIEARQAEFLDRANVDRTDRGLRSVRKMALSLFERAWAAAAGQGTRLSEEDAAGLYVHCLARVLHTRGIVVPAGSLPVSETVKRLMEGSQ